MNIFANRLAILNIFFMLIATAVAYAFPFELLLFSYAVLGPAHYLTEISWLHDRNYYTSGSKDYLFLVLLTVTMLLIPLQFVSSALMISAFLAALVMVKIRNPAMRISGIAFITLLVISLRMQFNFGDSFSVLLATIIHVYLFTGAFILYGALKRKDLLDIVSLVIFVGCGVLFFILPPDSSTYSVSSFVESNVQFLSSAGDILTNLLGLSPHKDLTLSVMGFFAFAYTYHYLNWFSKTKIIKWHEISKDRAAIIICVYFGSLALYAFNYSLGLTALLFLSLLHVLLEFPLNHLTFIGIGRELRLVFAKTPPTV